MYLTKVKNIDGKLNTMKILCSYTTDFPMTLGRHKIWDKVDGHKVSRIVYTNETEDTVYLDYIEVYRGYRGKGLGNELLTDFLDAVDKAHKQVYLLVDSANMTNEEAVRWYRKFGFVEKPKGSFIFMYRDAR